MTNQPRYINIPTTITIEVDDDFDINDEDALIDAVFDQYGKHIDVDARYLGYEFAEEV